MNTIDNLAINSIRILSADAIQKANSGHPGLPLGSAPMAYELWAHHMNHNPANPEWANRDRFILSGGHGSMLLYSLLHLFGYGLTKEDLMATSIDALAVGVTFALLPGVNIVAAVSFIGCTTFVLSAAGLKVGNVFGLRYKSRAELTGGIILILMGCKILLEHLGILNF